MADFDKDGHSDLVTANAWTGHDCFEDGTVSVLLGKGNGTFELAADYFVGSEPEDVAVADVNEDTVLDLIVASASCNGISVLLGTGDGTFGARDNFEAGPVSRAIAIGDFDGDGHADVAVACYNGAADSNVALLTGSGNGDFQQPAARFSSGSSGPTAILAADLDEDGALDLVVGHQGNPSVTVLRGNGDGSFLSPSDLGMSGGYVSGLAAADTDADGNVDLAVAATNDKLRVLRGSGGGSFATAFELDRPGSWPWGVLLADVTSDSRPDLIFSETKLDRLAILVGSGDGTFSSESLFPVGDWPRNVVMADFDEDGGPDLATPCPDSGAVAVLLNQCHPTRIEVGTDANCPGSQVSVPVIRRGIGAFGTMQFSMHWDPGLASFVGVEAFGLADMTYEDNFGGDPAAGTLTVSWEDPSLAGTIIPNGATLFALRFLLTGPLGSTCPITVDSTPVPIELTDPDFNTLSVETQSGALIETIDPRTIAGRVGYYQDARPVPGANLDLTGDTTATVQSQADGGYVHAAVPGCRDYRLTPAKTETEEDAIRAGVTAADAQQVRMHVLGKLPETLDSPYELLAADANGSRTITTVDVRLIRQLAADIRNSFPNVGLWRFVSSDFAFPDPLQPWDAVGYRDYSDLAVDMMAQDFVAIKVGDVNGSWGDGPEPRALAGGSREGVSLHRAPTPTTLHVASLATVPGSRVRVPVQASRTGRLTTAQFTLAWNPAILRFAQVTEFGLPGFDEDAFGGRRVADGRLSFAWDDPSTDGVNVEEGMVLFAAEFDVLGSPGTCSPVAIVNRPTVVELTSEHVVQLVFVEDGEVTVLGAPELVLGGEHGTDGPLTLRVRGLEGTRWQAEFSADLVHWVPMPGLAFTLPASGAGEVALPLGAGPRGFYRLVSVP